MRVARRARKDPVKKDIAIAVIAVVAISAITFGIAKMRPDLPFVDKGAKKETSTGSSTKVVMHVNGQEVTEAEFNAFLNAIPQQQREALDNPAGKRQIADEIVRMKTLEQEAKRLGVENDAEVKTQLELLRTQVIAQHALQKIVEQKKEAALRHAFDNEKKNALTLRHIVVAYQGGMVQPRQGGPRSEADAMEKAKQIAARIRGGADFSDLAKKESDDPDSAQRGGTLGPVRIDQLPPDVAAVVKTLKPGEVSSPVKTQLGIHLFTVSEPTLEDMRPALEQQVQSQIAREELDRLSKGAKVELDPKFFPPVPPTPVVPVPQQQQQPAPRGRG